MSIETALYSYLTSYAGLTALVGDRIYPLVIPEQAGLPAIAYQRISTRITYSHDGDSELDRTRFQFACVAKTAKEAREVAEQVVAALSAYSGPMDGLNVGASFIENRLDGYEPQPTDAYVVRVDALLWHDRS